MRIKMVRGRILAVWLIVCVLCLACVPSGAGGISKADAKREANQKTVLNKQAAKLYRDFLGKKSNKELFFMVTAIKGAEQPVLLVSDSCLKDRSAVSCDIYFAKKVTKNKKTSYELKKLGNITSNSTAYNIWMHNGTLIAGSHHYTVYAEVKNNKLYKKYYQGTFDSEGNETYTLTIFSGDKVVSKKNIEKAKGQRYIYDQWENMNSDNIIVFHKNTKENRAKKITI